MLLSSLIIVISTNDLFFVSFLLLLLGSIYTPLYTPLYCGCIAIPFIIILLTWFKFKVSSPICYFYLHFFRCRWIRCDHIATLSIVARFITLKKIEKNWFVLWLFFSHNGHMWLEVPMSNWTSHKGHDVAPIIQ
jgi:hypothetical protein